MEKTEILLKREADAKSCDAAFCLACSQCTAGKRREENAEWEEGSFQLYATESQHYFFYFALCMSNK